MPLNLPNLITVSRIALVPWLIWLLLHGSLELALLVLAVAATTDWLDGCIARRWHQQTALGQLLDPLADKLLIGTTMVCLTLLQLVPVGVTGLVVGRDILLLIGAASLRWRSMLQSLPPSRLGKLTTVVQLGFIAGVLLQRAAGGDQTPWGWLLWLMVGFTGLSASHYLYIGLRHWGMVARSSSSDDAPLHPHFKSRQGEIR